ncbi:MAG: HD domain-containing protein [Negativicutes bacterium]|nr:HD domain-containing protein [Negativicutes bacterium]
MIKELQVPIFELASSLSSAMDLISPAVANHHKQVAYIAFDLASELGLPMAKRKELLLAGTLHDIGALSLRERVESLSFELENPHGHAETGYRLLSLFSPFANSAEIVRFHHVPWQDGKGVEFEKKAVPLESHIIHLADRIAVLIDSRKEIFSQVPHILATIEARNNKMFHPQLVDCFKRLSEKEYFWLDVVASLTTPNIHKTIPPDGPLVMDAAEILSLTKLFAKMIDFRSQFTASHSFGVAATAEALARLLPYSERECFMMRIAGYLHDLGKLAIPVTILEKTSCLTPEEWNLVRRHTYYGYYMLKPIADFDTINSWASFHHERIDGNGYPFHIKGADLSLGARVMAVSDVFTAVAEHRPYRQAMSAKQTIKVLEDLSLAGGLDKDITDILKNNYDAVNEAREKAEQDSILDYRQFWELYKSS